MVGRLSWDVARHRPLTKIADELWLVDAELDLLPIGRRMVITRLGDGSLVVHNAVCADAATMTAIEALGPIAHLVVPSGHHRIDAAAWKHRYPALRVVCTAASLPRVGKAVAIDGDYASLPADPRLSSQLLAGVPMEGVFFHRDDRGAVTLICNDSFMNLPDRLPGVRGFVAGLLGSTGGPKVTLTAKIGLVRDSQAHADQLRALAHTPGLARVIPAHGGVLEGAAAPAGLARAGDALRRGR